MARYLAERTGRSKHHAASVSARTQTRFTAWTHESKTWDSNMPLNAVTAHRTDAERCRNTSIFYIALSRLPVCHANPAIILFTRKNKPIARRHTPMRRGEIFFFQYYSPSTSGSFNYDR